MNHKTETRLQAFLAIQNVWYCSHDFNVSYKKYHQNHEKFSCQSNRKFKDIAQKVKYYWHQQKKFGMIGDFQRNTTSNICIVSSMKSQCHQLKARKAWSHFYKLFFGKTCCFEVWIIRITVMNWQNLWIITNNFATKRVEKHLLELIKIIWS